MKIVVFLGSHRKNGNTARVAGLIEEELRRLATRNHEPLEIASVYLAHRDIRLCRGCRVCFDKGEEKCPLDDDLLMIRAKMAEADGIVVASPVYVDDVSGTVKNWIDRLAFVCHRPEFAGKCAYLVATVGDSPTGHALRTLSTALRTWGFTIAGQAGFKAGALMKPDELEARYRGKAERIAGRLFHAVRSQGFTRPSFLSLMTFKIQQRYWQRNPQDSLDYDYWRRHGWTDPRQEFYIRHGASRVKVATARLAGAVIGRLVT